jgi:hypothetical protein
MSRDIIPCWLDIEGRLWMDTGQTHAKTKEPIIELANGAVNGALGWVNKEFGPLERLGIQREPKSARASSPD